jgi:hypothetical protein
MVEFDSQGFGCIGELWPMPPAQCLSLIGSGAATGTKSAHLMPEGAVE